MRFGSRLGIWTMKAGRILRSFRMAEIWKTGLGEMSCQKGLGTAEDKFTNNLIQMKDPTELTVLGDLLSAINCIDMGFGTGLPPSNSKTRSIEFLLCRNDTRCNQISFHFWFDLWVGNLFLM